MRSMILASQIGALFYQRENLLGCCGEFDKFDTERGQSIIDGVCYCAGSWNRGSFSHALESSESQGRSLDGVYQNFRYLVRGRQKIINEGRRLQLSIPIVHYIFKYCTAYSVCKCSVNLAVSSHRVHNNSAIVDDEVPE